MKLVAEKDEYELLILSVFWDSLGLRAFRFCDCLSRVFML